MMWARQILQGSIYAVSSVLAAFIGGLGLGALAAAFLRRRHFKAQPALIGFCSLTALLLFAVPNIGEWLINRGSEGVGSTPPMILGNSLLLSSFWLLPLTVCIGGIFPLTWELAFGDSNHEGAVAGTAMAVNKLGSALGMIAGNFLILPTLGLSRGICIIGWGYLIFALIVKGRDRHWPTAPGWALLLITTGLGGWQTFRTPHPLGLFSNEQFLASFCGSYGEVAVVKNKETESQHILLNSQQRLSGTQRAISSQHHQGWVPLLFCRTPNRVMSIGMAAGISSDAMLDFPVKELDAVELVPEVVRAAHDYFEPWNHRLFTDPRVHRLIGDGRAVLNRSHGKFDAIICDLFFPNEDGTANLYSSDFFKSALARLNPDGLFCLWLPCYQHDEEMAGIVVRTFLDIFPYAIAVRSNLDSTQPVIGLIGSAQPLPVSRKFIQAQLKSPAGQAIAVKSPFFQSPENAWLLLAGDLHSADPGFGNFPCTTDDRPLFMFFGPRISKEHKKLNGMTFLNWIGKRFVRPLYPSCALDDTTPDEILGSLRAANFYFAAAVNSNQFQGDTRSEAVRFQQTAGYIRKAEALSPNAKLPIEALNQ